MSGPPAVAVIGTGAFATEFSRALRTATRSRVRVVLLGRDPGSLRRCRSAIGGDAPGPVHVETVHVEPSDRDLTPLVAAAGVDAVVVAASLHSPYSDGDSAWHALLRRTGFGVTTLLQCPLAIRGARAARDLGLPLVNACYPDAVNPILAALGLPVVCGLGNAHTLAAALAAPARLLAHHRHLTPPADPAEDVVVFAPPGRSPGRAGDTRDDLAAARRLPRRDRNALGARAGGELVADMLAGRSVRTTVPGPAGLPGGYPVEADGWACVPDLPEEVPLPDAVAWNRRHGAAEGVTVDGGVITFHGTTAAELDRLEVTTGGRVGCADWAAATHRLLAVRDRLGSRPASSGPVPAGPRAPHRTGRSHR